MHCKTQQRLKGEKNANETFQPPGKH